MTHPRGGSGAGPDTGTGPDHPLAAHPVAAAPVGPRGAVVRHRLRATGRWRLLLAMVTALGAPVLVSGAVEVSHRLDAAAGRATWVVPSRLIEMPAPPVEAGPPTRVRIPSIKVDSTLEALAVDSGTLASPKDFDRAGWYADGTVPGDTGPAVIAGHVDSRTGPAVFFRLHELKPGAEIDVERGGQWLVFNVTAVERYPKAQFPTEKVYGATPGAELRLITCGGTFDTRRSAYRDNVVVFAILAPETGAATG